MKKVDGVLLMESKKIVILTVSVGEGHNQISRALQEELERLGQPAKIIDIFNDMNSSYIDRIKALYFKLIYSAPQLWEFIFILTNKSYILAILDKLISFLWRDLFDFFKDEEYIIITTHPLATFLGRKIKESSAEKYYLFAVLSDFTTHNMSLTPLLDGLFIAREEEKQSISQIIKEVPIFPYGIPLRSVWDERKNKRELRKGLNLPLYERLIVISGGSEGIFSHVELLEILERDRRPSHIVWFTGVSEDREKMDLFLTNGSYLKYMPFSNDYHQYVKAADLLISKPGGVTMAEALRLGIPTGIYSPLAGQEKMNEQYLCQSYLTMKEVGEDFIPSDFILACLSIRKESNLMKTARQNIVNKIVELSELSIDENSTNSKEVEREENRRAFLIGLEKKHRSSS